MMDMPELTAVDLHVIGIEKTAPLLMACAALKADAARRGDGDPLLMGRHQVGEGLAPVASTRRPIAAPRSLSIGLGLSDSSGRAVRAHLPAYENVSFTRDSDGNVRTHIGEVELSEPALKYIKEPAPAADPIVGFGMSAESLELMLRIVQQQEDEERKQIDARFARMEGRITRLLQQKEILMVSLDPSLAHLGAPAQLNRLGRFFHGVIDRKEAESRLQVVGSSKQGVFLIRQKEAHTYVLSFVNERLEMTHLLIERAVRDGVSAGFMVHRNHLQHCLTVLDVIDELFRPVAERKYALYPMQFAEHNGIRTDEVGV